MKIVIKGLKNPKPFNYRDVEVGDTIIEKYREDYAIKHKEEYPFLVLEILGDAFKVKQLESDHTLILHFKDTEDPRRLEYFEYKLIKNNKK